MQTGTIKFLHPEKGFGFIIPDQPGDEVFFHKQDITGAAKMLATGEQVSYTVKPTGKEGQKKQGLNVTSLNPNAQAALASYDAYGAPPAANNATLDAYSAAGIPTGTVKWFSAEKGYGFIVASSTGEDVYFKAKDVVGEELKQGEQVTYAVTFMGAKQQAINVNRVGPAATSAYNPAAPAYNPAASAYDQASYDQASYATDPYTMQMMQYQQAMAYATPEQQQAYADYYAQYGASVTQASQGYGYTAALPAAPATAADYLGGETGPASGMVKWYSEEKGFGFIVPASGGGDIYFKGQDVTGPALESNEAVKYNVIKMGSGKMQANQVVRVAGGAGGMKRKAGDTSAEPNKKLAPN